VAYMDKQIRRVISILKDHGGSITFTKLFDITANEFDALSAILSTGKKRGVVFYKYLLKKNLV
jgi:hypothetical protein